MRFIVLASIVACVWQAIDHEIFDLQQTLSTLFPTEKATFYTVLQIPQTASTKDITAAYRRTSLKYHPDKLTPDSSLPLTDDQAKDYYKTLTAIQTILRSPLLRSKYNTHLKRGFPIWNGQHYQYSRFQPSLIFIFVFLTIIISIAEYIIKKIFYIRECNEINDRKVEEVKRRENMTKRQLLKDDAVPKLHEKPAEMEEIVLKRLFDRLRKFANEKMKKD